MLIPIKAHKISQIEFSRGDSFLADRGVNKLSLVSTKDGQLIYSSDKVKPYFAWKDIKTITYNKLDDKTVVNCEMRPGQAAKETKLKIDGKNIDRVKWDAEGKNLSFRDFIESKLKVWSSVTEINLFL